MKKKLIVGLIIVGLLLTTLPIATARIQRNIEPTVLEKYENCYVEIDGLISLNDYPRIIGINMWKMIFLRISGKNNPDAFVFYWYLLLDETAEISVYTEENGDLLWQHDGQGTPEIRILWFTGSYIASGVEEDRLHIDMDGQTRAIWKNEY